MTEIEWLKCRDARTLWRFVHDSTTARKANLACVACIRRALAETPSAQVAAFLEMAEQLADGQVNHDAIRHSRVNVVTSFPPRSNPRHNHVAMAALHLASPELTANAVCAVLYDSANATADEEKGYAVQCHLLREIIGNPFRPIVFSPNWRTDTVVTLARTMYDAREFSAMPILADALQDAGCDNHAILNHCRHPAEHARGCWVLDLVLGES